MNGEVPTGIREIVEGSYRSDSRYVLATLIRLLADFELAEEALHDAFTAALQQWPRDGVPSNPRAWRSEHSDAFPERPVAFFDDSVNSNAVRWLVGLVARPIARTRILKSTVCQRSAARRFHRS